MKIDSTLTAKSLLPTVDAVFQLAGEKILRLDSRWKAADGAPVFTVNGKYSARGWTEWTQGFQFGAALLTFDATNDQTFLNLGRSRTTERMAAHITHTGVHDHGFNNISTYGALRRLMLQNRIPHNDWELKFYEMALLASGSVQAMRWAPTIDNLGYVYSFNGPQSLFIDTIRSMRSLAIAHQLGHSMLGENDAKISLLERLLKHGLATAKYNIFYGTGRDSYDTAATRGRTAHESIFNTNEGRFRCPSSQQGYSPFSTWTRGLAWAMLGFAEELEFLKTLPDTDFAIPGLPTKKEIFSSFEAAARATCDFYIEHSALDGICYWDTGAPEMHKITDYQSRPADPYNPHEPVDSSAGAIAAQGFLRLGTFIGGTDGSRYIHAGLHIARSLFADPYLSKKPEHEGILLHSVYHRPNGWDNIPSGQKVPCDESSMWGDYHALELALLIQKMAAGEYLTFFDAPVKVAN